MPPVSESATAAPTEKTRGSGQKSSLITSLCVVAALGCKAAAPPTVPRPDAAQGVIASSPSTSHAKPKDPPRGRHIAILYTSNLRGEYESCGCPSHPLGGLVRRASLTDQIRAEVDAIVQVDAGDLIAPAPQDLPGQIPPLPEEIERRAKLLLAAYARLGVAAVAPGETDLLLGPSKFAALARAAKVPVLCANLNFANGKAAFERDRIITTATGIKVGLFGIIDPPPDHRARWQASWQLVIGDPAKATRDEIASLRNRGAQIVVALLHLAGGSNEARLTIAQAPGIDFAVLGHQGHMIETPEPAGSTRLLEAFELGKYLGRLDVHVVNDNYSFIDRGQRAQLLQSLKNHKSQLADFEKRAAEDRNENVKAYFLRMVGEVRTATERDTKALDNLADDVASSWIENRMVELDPSITDHPGMLGLVNPYNDENRRRGEKGLPVGVKMRYRDDQSQAHARSASGTAATAPAESWTYASSNGCALCHAPAQKQWEGTAHAHALATLQKRGRDHDPGCITCHTTGFERPGGTRVMKTATTFFANVGCESCHGPGVEHVRATDKKQGIRKAVPVTVCRECHTADQTNGEFDYPLFVKAVLGPGHGLPPQP